MTKHGQGPEGRSLRDWYRELDNERATLLDRKREHASLVMPHLLPWEGRAMSTPLDVPYSSVPADGVNSLASRLMGVVLPLNGQPIFEISNVSAFDPEGQDDTDLQDVLSRFGRYTMRLFHPTNLRSQLVLLYDHLAVVGDALLEMDEDLNARIYRADQYVVRRKHEGDWVDIIIQEAVLPEWHEELKNINRPKVQEGAMTTGQFGEDWEPLYTWVHKDPKTKKVTKRQEFRDGPVGEAEEFTTSPFMPARWKSIVGEPYGISLIEDIFGDVRAIDILAKGLLDGVLLNAEYRWGVNPAGLVEIQDLLDSVNGDYVPTGPNDVFPLQFQNHAQVAATHEALQHRENILDNRFLKRTVRDAERVTAREIVLDAQELESKLGGILSMAGREIQDPIVRWALYQMGQKDLIPSQISEEIEKQDGLVKLSIKAGLEVLQREAEREKLDGAIERIRNLPPEAHQAFNWPEIAKDWWQSMGLDSAGRIKTSQQLADEQRQAMQAQAAQQAAVAAASQPQQQQPPQGE